MASRMTTTRYIEKARELYDSPYSSLEIDGDAAVSRNDDPNDHGAYVAAWVWVPDDDGEDTREQEEEDNA